MKTIYVSIGDDGRIESLIDGNCIFDGYIPVEVDDSFDVMTIDDYRLKDGALEYTGEGTAAREEAEEQQKRVQKVQDASVAFFADGGKEKMEADIEAASGGADPEPLFDVLMPMSELQGEIAEVRYSVSQQILKQENRPTKGVWAYRSGSVVTVTVDIAMTIDANESTMIGTLPEWARPAVVLYGAIVINASSGRIAGQLSITENGVLTLYTSAWSSSQVGTVSYIVP